MRVCHLLLLPSAGLALVDVRRDEVEQRLGLGEARDRQQAFWGGDPFFLENVTNFETGN